MKMYSSIIAMIKSEPVEIVYRNIKLLFLNKKWVVLKKNSEFKYSKKWTVVIETDNPYYAIKAIKENENDGM